MSMSDPISDMLTRIRNAGRVRHPELTLPSSRIKESISEVLKKEGYIVDYHVIDEKDNKKSICIKLKYYKAKPVISGIERISLPSRRMYAKSKKIPRTLGGLGEIIMTTSQGIITGREAKKKNIGGEILCKVW